MPLIGNQPRRDLLRYAPALVAVIAFVVAVVRAATLSVTYDEAWEYEEFVAPGWNAAFQYSQANHLLNTLLVHLSTDLLGVTGFTIRIPALLGAALYLVCVWRICVRCVPGVPAATAVAAVLSLNPLILDMLSVGRGYGMALGLLCAAILFVLKDGETTGARRPWLALASISLALCVCAHIAFAIAASGVALAALASVALGPPTEDRRMPSPVTQLLLPGAIVAGGLLLPIIPGALEKQSYGGFLGSSNDTVRDVLNALFYRRETAARTGSAFQWNPDPHAGATSLTRVIVLDVGANLLTVLTLGLLVWIVVESASRLAKRALFSSVEKTAWLSGFALLFNWGVYEVLHYVRDMAFPLDRHALFILPLTVFAATCAIGDDRVIRRLFAAGCAAVLLLSLGRFDPRYFRSWMYDAGTERLFGELERFHEAHPNQSFEVGTTQAHALAIKFYQLARHADWITDVRQADFPVSSDDFFIFHPEDVYPITLRGFDYVAVDPVSGERLIRRNNQALPRATNVRALRRHP